MQPSENIQKLDFATIECEKIRLPNGTYGPVKLIVLNGSDFKPGAGCDHAAKYGAVDLQQSFAQGL